VLVWYHNTNQQPADHNIKDLYLPAFLVEGDNNFMPLHKNRMTVAFFDQITMEMSLFSIVKPI